MGNPCIVRYAAAIALTLSASPAVAAADLYCTFSEKVQCNPGQGCKPMKPGIHVFIHPDRNEYSRCEGSSCDTFTFVRSGDNAGFVTIELSGRGTFAKLGPDKSIAEVVSLGRFILISYGKCEAGPPPIIRSPK